MESGHVVRRGDVRPEDLHLFVQAVVQDQRVGDAQPVWLHRVAGTVVKVSHVRIVKVNNFFLRTHFVNSSETDSTLQTIQILEMMLNFRFCLVPSGNLTKVMVFVSNLGILPVNVQLSSINSNKSRHLWFLPFVKTRSNHAFRTVINLKKLNNVFRAKFLKQF